MKGIALLCLRSLGLAAAFAAAATLTAQTLLPSTVSITATPSPLILPGTLTLSYDRQSGTRRGRGSYWYGNVLL